MSHFIIKLKEWYFNWSTVVDAPITNRMTLEELTAYIQFQYKEHGARELSKRLDRVERKGTSAFLYESVEEVISGNRAGENETELTMDEIIDQYQEGI